MPAGWGQKASPNTNITAYITAPHIMPSASPWCRLYLPHIYEPVNEPQASENSVRMPESIISFSNRRITAENIKVRSRVTAIPINDENEMLRKRLDQRLFLCLCIKIPPHKMLIHDMRRFFLSELILRRSSCFSWICPCRYLRRHQLLLLMQGMKPFRSWRTWHLLRLLHVPEQ